MFVAHIGMRSPQRANLGANMGAIYRTLSGGWERSISYLSAELKVAACRCGAVAELNLQNHLPTWQSSCQTRLS